MSNEIMDLRERCREGQFLSDEPSAESGLTMPPETPIPPAALMKLSVRSRNVLHGMFKNPTVGDLCGLDDERWPIKEDCKEILMGCKCASLRIDDTCLRDLLAYAVENGFDCDAESIRSQLRDIVEQI